MEALQQCLIPTVFSFFFYSQPLLFPDILLIRRDVHLSKKLITALDLIYLRYESGGRMQVSSQKFH